MLDQLDENVSFLKAAVFFKFQVSSHFCLIE